MVSSQLSPAPAAASKVIVLTHPQFENSGRFLKGIADYNRQSGSHLQFTEIDSAENAPATWLDSEVPAGIISQHTSVALTDLCRDRGIPLVDVSEDSATPGVFQIGVKQDAVGQLGARHFLQLGFKSFAFACLNRTTAARKRRDSFVAALTPTGAHCDVFDMNVRGGKDASRRNHLVGVVSGWIQLLPKPVAIMATSDAEACLVLEAVRHCGLDVPNDVAVLGVGNDVTRCELQSPSLSSIETLAGQAGFRAAEVIDQWIQGRAPDRLREELAPAELVVRLSTGCHAVSDPRISVALRFIQSEALRGIRVDDVVSQANMSRSQLEKKFRKHLGRTPLEEIRRVQMSAIQKYLIETDWPLKQIADQTGFEYVEYLSFAFKRNFGVAPGAYRRQHRAANVRKDAPAALPVA